MASSMKDIAVVATRSRKRQIITSGLALRLLLAFIISWLIVLAFFVTSVVSH